MVICFPVTIGEECSRFLFTLGDAVDTVLSALNQAQGGEVFIPKIKSFSMNTIIQSVKQITKSDQITIKNIGMRPGERLHEDMLAATELPFTREVDGGLLAVLPQYTNKTHTHSESYDGREFNSSLHLDTDVDNLVDLIMRGIEDAN